MAPHDQEHEGKRMVGRRSFLRSGGVATGIAVAAAIPAVADADGTPIDHPGTQPPDEPVMAYVHDAKRGEVTIMSGTEQITYRDRALVKRLMKAANRKLG